MRISDWSSDVCSSDLQPRRPRERRRSTARGGRTRAASRASDTDQWRSPRSLTHMENGRGWQFNVAEYGTMRRRSEEHTSELQSLMRISYAVFCLKTNKRNSQKDKSKNI